MRYLAPGAQVTPKLYFVRHFLDDVLCRQISLEVQQSTVQPATVSGLDGMHTIDEGHRRTSVAAVSPDIERAVGEPLMTILPNLERHFGAKLAQLEGLQ